MSRPDTSWEAYLKKGATFTFNVTNAPSKPLSEANFDLITNQLFNLRRRHWDRSQLKQQRQGKEQHANVATPNTFVPEEPTSETNLEFDLSFNDQGTPFLAHPSLPEGVSPPQPSTETPYKDKTTDDPEQREALKEELKKVLKFSPQPTNKPKTEYTLKWTPPKPRPPGR